MAEHVVYVYGTLRPGAVADVTTIKGALFDLGSFPGLILDVPPSELQEVVCERLYVDDEELRRLDAYEGYFEDDDLSLYVRRRYKEGWIYLFNRSVEGYPRIESGDWFIR